METDYQCLWLANQRLQSLEGVKNVPCRYRVKPKSWIWSELFEELFKEIDQNVGAQNRNIAFIIDNCPAHQKYHRLIIIFLNTTSITQPVDQEVIRSLIEKYCSLAVTKQIDALEKGNQ